MAKTQILIEDPDLEYELDEDDVLEYAKQIGIDIRNEQHLMWIAEEGLTANLPKGWFLFSDANNRISFGNIETGENSLQNPLDKEYCALVIEERKKALSSSLSDCRSESKSPLDPIRDGSHSPGRFPKAPLPQLSSLSDAPPLSSSGKATPSLKHGSNVSTAPEKKFEMGRFENRRGTKLAPVKLNSFKMPASSATQKTGSGMSFMPKGTSLTKNIRRVTADEQGSHLSESRNQMALPQDDFNESMNSDDGSKYSYEETDEDVEKSYDDMNPSDMGSQFSPTHSANDSPEAFDINSLVQLGAKMPSKSEATKKLSQLQTLNEEQAPSLSLRKGGQPSFLKPLQQAPLKKPTSKAPKKSIKASPLNSRIDQKETEDLDDRISILNEEQKIMLDRIQKEWIAMQENLEREERARYEKLVKESSKRFDEEESLLRKENEEKISKLKSELIKNIKEEENACQVSLTEIKKANELKFNEEQQGFSKKLESLVDSQKAELENMEQKNALDIAEKKKKLHAELETELIMMKNSQQDNIKNLLEAQASEITLLEKAHKEKVLNLQDSYSKDEIHTASKSNESSNTEALDIEIEKTKLLLEGEKGKYQQLLSDLEKLRTEIAIEKEAFGKLEEKTTAAQTYYEEIQDDVDKTENDLDLLRTEKSALVSELNILKASIKSEKSNLQNLERKQESPVKRKLDSKDKGVNTVTSSTDSQSSQTYLQVEDGFCQTKEDEVLTKEAQSQTCLEKSFETTNTSCQVNLFPNELENSSNSKNVTKSKFAESMASENTNMDAIISKVLQNALLEVNNKIDARFKSIEDLVGTMQKNADSAVKKPATQDSFFSNNINSAVDVDNIPHGSGLNAQTSFAMNEILPLRTTYLNPTLPGKKCSCEIGDSDSCNIMQDVKNSIYRLNDILSSSFVPSISSAVPVVGPPIPNYSNSLESFYTQFRKLQERQRITDLKHKCQNNSTKQHKNLMSSTDMHFVGQDQFNHPLNTNPYSLSLPGDPIVRARNLVLREQARTWKQQQQFLTSSDSQAFLPVERNYNLSISDNVSQSASRVSSSFSERSAIQYPFLKFEPDPESDYNEWMSRLKTLQDKIRSHKLL